MNKYILIVFSCLISLLTNAQTDTSGIKPVNLNEVVISVNKDEEQRKDITQQITLIKTTQIENSQSQTTADLLSKEAGLHVQKSQSGGGSPIIRGFEASRIVLVVDGVRMNNLIYRAGHLQNILTIDNNVLDRVEVLYGPSSTVYGSDALGGVIHLYTKKPQFSFSDEQKIGVNAFARYGSVNNEMTGHASFNIGGKNLASLTSITYSDFDHLRGGTNQNPFDSISFGERPYYVERINGRDSLVKNEDRYLQVQSGYNQIDILEKISYKQNENTIHSLNLQYSNSSDMPRYDRLTDPDGAGLRYSEWYYGPQKRLLAAYDLDVARPSSYFQHMHVNANYQDIEESRHQRRFGNDNLQHRIEKVNVMGATADVRRSSVNNTLRIGVDLQYNTLESTAREENIATGVSDKLDTRYPDGDNNMTNVAAYYSHTWRINDKFTLTDGIRVGMSMLKSEIVDTSFFHLPYTTIEQNNFVYSGSVGIINMPTDDLKLSLQVATGFRVPNIDDMAKIFESAPGNIIVPNPDLKPEKTLNVELGVTKIYNGKTSWENYIYNTSFYDAIVTDEFTYNGEDTIMYNGSMSRVLANQNKRRAWLFGFSSNIRSQCTDNLVLSFGLNYTYGRIKTDSSDVPLDHIPPFIMNMQLDYSFEKFAAGFAVHYNGWKHIEDYNSGGEDNEQYAPPYGMPAWFTANFYGSYQVHKYIAVQAGVENIFDTQYRTFASGINGAGRNVYASIRFRY